MRLTARAIHHGFGGRQLLSGIDLEVAQGDSVAILGPSGSGKTTLLSILGGLLQPARGTVAVIAADDGHASPKQHVSWVFQTVNVLPDRSVLDNAALSAFADGRTRREAEVAALTALRAVGLEGAAGQRTRDISGGELQRVVLARALACSRPFILADEPTGQLDRATTHQVVEALVAVSGCRGLIVVTHDRSVAERCSCSLELRDGVLVPA